MSSTATPTTTSSPPGPGVSGTGSFGEVFFVTLAVTLVACIWILYLAFYNARVSGFLLTKIINKFIKQGHLHVGSFSFSVLSGKVMFYDVAYITEDSTIRAQHGLLIFRWWRPYTPLGGQEDTSQCETRLTVFLSSCEVHFYNKTSLYAQLEKAFGLPPEMTSHRETETRDINAENDGRSELQRRHDAAGISWRDFFGVIKFEISDGRFVFGNKLVPSVLMLNIEDCHGIYTTREPECRWDQFTHEVKCTAEGLRAVLAPSPKYDGPVDEPPRYMGDGFVVMQSSKVQIHYVQDEPGLVPTPEELMEQEDDDQPFMPPVSVLDITCQKKGTHFTYGPWADRQREFLMKFFYPQQYNTQPATPPAVPGDKRQFEKLDITLNIVEEATIDILFTKNKETNAFHIDMKRGSYIEISIPQLVGIEGYNTKIVGQLLLLDADTSLPYRSFIKSETLEFKVDVHYPRAWNHPQNWEVSLTFSKANWFFIYAHKVFLADLMSDWSSKGRQDLFNFVPYTVRLNITLHQFELMLPVNEYNWVDCSHHEENVCIGLVGEQLEMSIVLQFADYLPQTVPIRILIKADAVSGYLFLPDCYTSQHLFTALDKSAKASCSYLENKKSMGLDRHYWRHNTDHPNWIECACVPVVALCIMYNYHPSPLDEDVPRIVVKQGPRGKQHWSSVPPQTSYGGWRRGESMVDPGSLSADSLQLEVDIGPLLVMTYGPLIKMIPSLKEDFLGLNQDMVDFMSPLNRKARDKKEEPTKYADSRVLNPMALRPFNITVSLNIDGIKGFLPKYCSKADVGCATLVMEQLCFEMCREFTQTKLQLLLSPILLMVPNSPSQDAIPPSNQPERGQMALSGLQLRCHAMFSRAGIPPDSETVEYAWLIDLQMGALSGQLTVAQLLAIAESLSLTIPLIIDPVDNLAKPARPQMCVHMVDSERCAAREGGIYPSPCASEDDLKYRVVRVAVNAVQLQLVENTTALEIKVNQIRLATCNLHSETVGSGLTALVNHIDIHQYLLQSDHPSYGTSSKRPLRSEPLQNWLEVGAINLGPVCVDCVGFLQEVSDYRMQHYFLMMHDEKTKRLWFLWPPESLDRVYPSSVKCGCQGGCAFFSDKPYGTHFFKVVNGTHSQRSSWNDEFQQKESDYGRSLLQEGKWVFSVCDRTPADSPTKAFKFTPGWVGLASPTSPGDQYWQTEEKNGEESEEPVEAKKEQSQSESSQQSSTGGILRRESQRSQQSHVSQQSDSAGSAVRSSICSEPTSHQHCDSSSTISSNTAPVDAQLVGSSHSLPVDSQQQQQSGVPPPPRNYSTDTMSKAGRAMHFEQYPQGPDRTRASSIDSPTSGADSEYFSAGEDSTLAAAIRTSNSSTSIPSTVHPPTDSGSSLSEFKVQSTISSSDHHSPEQMDSATSTESFVSAASSEDTLIRMRDEKDGAVKRKDLENHSPYSPYLTRVTSHRWSVPLSLESWKQYVNFDPADMTPSSSMYQASIQMMGFVKQQQGVSPEIITAVDSDITSSDSEDVSDHSSVRHASDHRDASLQDLHERLFAAETSHTTTSAIKLEPSSGTSVFAEIQGPVNVLMTPLLLVAINRYVDAAKAITTSQHPATLLSSLHHSCIADVESLFLRGLLPEGGSSSSLSRQQQQASANFNNNADSEEREDGTKTVTMTVKLPKVNLCVLQVPEDGVGVPSLTSNNASLLIAQLGSSEANLWIKQIDRSIKVENQNTAGKKAPQDTQAAVAMGASEQSDPTVVTLIKFFKLHAQLRRLAKPGIKTIESPTAIPEQYTQVQFTLSSKVPPNVSADEADSRYSSLPRKRRLSVHMPKSWIMAESGMEEISIKCGRQGGDIPLPKIKLAGDSKKSEKRTDKKDTGSSGKKRTDSSSSAREGSGKRKRRDRFSSGGSSLEKPPDTKERGLDFCIHISSFWSHLPTPPQPKKESFIQGSDTNLLTTASPALDEWLRAMTGLTTSVGDIVDARHFRSCALMACIMAEAHDNLENHQPLPKKKQTRWAAISDAMLQDLSCQLMGILWRYLASADWQKIEEIVSGEDLPALSSLESGTNTLIRQWKVTLSLINPQVNVARFPQQVAVYKSPEERGLLMEDEMWTPRQISEDPMSDVPPSAGHTGDSELMDPLTLSLYSDRIGVGLQKSIYAEFSGRVQPHSTDWLREMSSSNRHREQSGDSATRYRSLTNTSNAGSASGTSAKKWKGGYKTLDEEDKHDAFSPASSMCSDDITDNLDKSNPRLIDDDEFDGGGPVGNLDIDLESGSAYLVPGTTPAPKSPVVTPTVQQFGDADTLFRPLLTNLGLHKKKSSQPLAKLIQSVGQVSFQFKLDQFRVVITKSSSKHLRSTRAPRSADTPAFLCEKIHIRAMMRETAPSEKSESLFKATSTTFFSGSSSIEICCDIHVGSVVQVINMAILRLLSQVIQMVENFQHAKTDLKLKQYVSSMPQGEGSIADLRVRAANSRHTRNPSRRSNKVFTPPNMDTLGRTRQSSQRSRNLKFKEHETASLYSTAESFDSHAESDSIPKCWQTMYHLINLYSGVNEPVSVATTHVFVNPLFSAKGNERSGGMMEGVQDLGLGMPQDRDALAMGALDDLDGTAEEAIQPRPDIEGLEVSLIGTILVDEVCLLAQLAGLHLEADTTYITGSFSLQQTLPMQGYVPAALWRKFPSIGASLQTTAVTLELSEKAKKDFYTIASLTIDKPQSTVSLSGSLDHQNQVSLATGVDMVNLTVPMNLSVLSAVVSRSSKKLAQRIQQLKQTQKSYRSTQEEVVIAAAPSKPSLSGSKMDETWPPGRAEARWTLNGVTRVKTVVLQASVLPQLQAQYTIDGTSGTASWGEEGTFAADITEHSFKFISTVPAAEFGAPAKITFPGIHFKGRYGLYDAQNESSSTTTTTASSRQGSNNILEAVTEIQAFQHTLSPDLVNHLITVQKVILKELNNMVRGIQQTHWPVLESSKTKLPPSTPTVERLTYSMQVRLEGIQVTATSPTASAVRFETGVVELELSNRPHTETDSGAEDVNPGHGMRMFAKALIEFNLSLGTLVKNPVFIEAEPEFHEMAYFKTKIGLRNTVKEINDDLTEGKDTLLITLNRPTLFVQSSAADRAVLLWLSYTSSYDQWAEQWKTMAQDDNLQGVAVNDSIRLPLIRNQEGGDSTLFLQLTVQELGICIPILPSVQNLGVTGTRPDMDCHSALVLTLESSLISACYSNSLATKGSFHTICLRFTEDFQMAMDDWRPSSYDHIMNSCVIPQGTYEVCSSANSNQAKDFHRMTIGQWRLNFKWRMEGIDVQFDPSVGHQLTALANTLTSLTGADDDIADLTSVNEQQEVSSTDVLSDQEVTPLKRPTSLKVDPNDEKSKSKAIMQEINEQAKVVSDLRTLGAKSGTIAEEADKLRQMETAVFKDFRRDIRKKLKAQGMKVSGRDKPSRRKSVKPQGSGALGRTQKERHASYVRQSTFPMTPYDSEYQHQHNLYDTPSSMKTPKNTRSTLYPDPPSRVSFVLPLHTPSPTTPEATPMGWGTDLRQGAMSRLGLGLESGMTPMDLNATIGDPTRIQEEIRQNRKSIRRRLTLHSTPMSRNLDGSDTEEEEEEEEEEEKEKYSGQSAFDDMDGSLSSTLRGKEGAAPSAVLSRSSAARDHASSTASPARSVAPEPELQLHLDVSIFIDSGKLTLHCHRPGPPVGPNDHLIPDALKQESRRPWNSTESSPSRKPGVKSQLSSASSSSTSGIKLKSGTLPSMLSSQGFALFNLPAVDVKVEYQSEPENKQDPNNDTASTSMQSSPRQNLSTSEGGAGAGAGAGGGVEKKNGARRGSLFCWARLLTPAEEIVVTTSLLDFLEQALETIPSNIGMLLTSPSSENLDVNPSNLEASANSLVSSSSLDYTTFPVDVVVYVCMDPSLVHLSCLPASKVECLLQLPCVEFAFSSRGGQQTSGFSGDVTGGDRSGTDFQDAKDDLSASKLSFSRCRSRHLSNEEIREEANKADMSLSAVLSNFSLVIFHPYGGGQFRRDGGKLVEEMLSNMSVSSDAHDDTSKLSSGSARKDALSLEVTFVRVNVSRKRHKLRPTVASDQTLVAGMEESRRLGESLRSDSTSVSSATMTGSKAAATLNKFSIMCDVGSATFRYDMRRLTEVLAFPKAWYRKSIVQRLFFGEEEEEEDEMSTPEDEVTSIILSSDSSTDSEDSFTDLPPRRYQRKRTPTSAATSGTGTPSSTGPSTSTTASPTSPGSKGSKEKFPYNPPSPSLFSIYSQLPSPSSPTLSQPGTPLMDGTPPPRSSPDLRRMVTEKRLSKEDTISQSSEPSGSEHSHSQATSDPCSSSGSLVSGPSWKTVLLVVINFTKVDTHMNMSNVMGSTLWSTEDLRCQTHLTIDSTGHRIFKITTGLKNSSLEAKGGVIGGLLEVSKLSCTSSQVKIPGKEPHHDLQLQLDSLESRIDYMGSSSLLARLTSMEIACEDEWKFRANSDPKVKYHTVESVYANSNITWDTMQLMICRSTTPDMLRIAVRLEEFFTQQFASSRRMLSTWDPIATAASQLAAARKASISTAPISTAPIDEIDGRGHKGSKTDSAEEPKEYQHWQSVFDFLIQTFHNAHKNQPRPEGMRLGGQVTLQGRQALLACFHGLNFRSNSWALFTMREPKVEFETEALQVPSSEHCGEDTLVLQDLLFSLGHNQTQREQGWLATILRVSKNDKSQFPFTGPMLEAFQYVSSISTPEEFEQYFQYGDLPSQRRGTLRHEADPIFALPKLQLEMKSKQLQKLKLQKPGTPSPPLPEVQVTFVTLFTDHINVSMDFELILFLHDMVLAYINYKQKVMAPMKPMVLNPSAHSQLPSSTEKKLASLKSATLQSTSSSQRPPPSTLSSSSSSPSPSSTTSPASVGVVEGKKRKEEKKGGQGNVAKAGNGDCRLFVCATWQLEPTIRLLSWGGKQIEPVGVDYILQKLGFHHARTTIPKWIQRGAMDPADKLLSLLAKNLLMIIMEREKSDAEKQRKDKALPPAKASSKQGFPGP